MTTYKQYKLIISDIDNTIVDSRDIFSNTKKIEKNEEHEKKLANQKVKKFFRMKYNRLNKRGYRIVFATGSERKFNGIRRKVLENAFDFNIEIFNAEFSNYDQYLDDKMKLLEALMNGYYKIVVVDDDENIIKRMKELEKIFIGKSIKTILYPKQLLKLAFLK